jgi:ribosomal protein S18 acetylase RimI-like enzyme
MLTQTIDGTISEMHITVRDAQPDDVESLVELLQELFAIEADFTADTSQQRKGLLLLLDGCGKHRCLKVAQVDDQVVGMCSAQALISTAEGGWVALVEDMVVSASYRGTGVGRRLMAAIEIWARQRGMTRLQLLADRTNFAALDFYDKMGWCPTQLICLRRQWDLKTL